jgi:streptogramin lyase
MLRCLVSLLLTLSAFAQTDIALAPDALPVSLAIAEDGTIWYVTADAEIGRVLPSGEVQQVNNPDPNFFVGDSASIVALPDGGALAGDQYNGYIARVDSAMNVTVFDVRGGSSWAHVNGMTLGADGAAWFIVSSFLCRFDVRNGAVQRFLLPASDPSFRGMVAMPDGSLRIFGQYRNLRATTSGEITVLDEDRLPGDWYELAADGTVWSSVGYLEPNGTAVYLDLGGRDGAFGPDGNLWVASRGNSLRAYDAEGTLVREVPFANPNANSFSIASFDGSLWYGMRGAIRHFRTDSADVALLRRGDLVTVERERNCCWEGTHSVVAFHRPGSSPFLRRIDVQENLPDSAGVFALDSSRVLVEKATYGLREPTAVDVLDGNGVRRAGFGGPRESEPEGVVVDRSGRVHMLRSLHFSPIVLLSYSRDGAPLNDVPVALPNSTTIGMQAVDLAADQCTLFYVGFGQRFVGRTNICTLEALPDLDLPERTRDLRVLANGDVLVVFENRLVRYGPDGAIVREYEGDPDHKLWSVALDIDPAFVWIGTDELWRMRLSDGSVVERLPVYGPPVKISVVGEPRAARLPARRRSARP